MQSLQYTKRPLVGEIMLKVEHLKPVTSVIVHNIKEEMNEKDMLKVYFSSKRSGGADVKEVMVFGSSRALVTFKDPNSELCIALLIRVRRFHI